MIVDDSVLDDTARMASIDKGDMLACVASSGAQMRRAVDVADHDALSRIADGGKPRAIVVAGMGGSGVSGDVLAAVAGPSTSVPISVERTHVLPGWVSAMDLVIAISCSGSTEETLAVASAASRRGARLITIGAENSPLASISENTSGAIHLSIDAQGRMPRASLWTIATPLLLVANALGIADVPEKEFETAAAVMDALSVECGPSVEVANNPAKLLGINLAESVPMIWGTGGIGRATAGRFMAQLAENAKLPAIHGSLPEVGHNQIVAFDGVFATSKSDDDIFADPGQLAKRLHLVLLRDEDEHEAVAKRVNIITDIAAQRDIPVTELTSQGTHPLSRIASLVVPSDWASVYTAIALGIDPSPIEPIMQLKAGLSQ